jgi:hypothetical protein
MARAAAQVDGVVQPDIDTIPDGVGVAVSAPGPVQGSPGVEREPTNVLEWEVVSLDGKSHGTIKIITH